MNKYRRLTPQPSPPDSTEDSGLVPTDSGYRSDVSSFIAPLNTASEMVGLRHEKRGIRRDFGKEDKGGAADSTIRAIGEYKIIIAGELRQDTFRLYRNEADKGVAEIWNGAAWEELATSQEIIQDGYWSVAPTQNILAVGDGSAVFRVSDIFERVGAEFDFPSGEVLTEEGESTEIEVSGVEGKVEGSARINFRVKLYRTTSVTDVDATLRLGFYLNDELEKELVYGYDGEEDDEIIEFEDFVDIEDQLENGDEVKIEVLEFDGTTSEIVDDMSRVDDDRWEVARSRPTAPAEGDSYTYRYTVEEDPDPEGGDILLNPNGDGFEVIGAIVALEGTFTHLLVEPGLGEGTEFAVEGNIKSGQSATGPNQVEWTAMRVAFEVKGLNEGEDYSPGLVIDEFEIGPVFELIEGSPGARYVFAFADRLIGLQDGEDRQALSWTASGDVLDWEGTGAGQIFLVDTTTDSIDDLMCGAPIGSNIAVVIRKRSIYRVFETGNSLQAIGATRWIEGIGTESRFSLQVVPGGVMFLAHNLVVYYMTEAGTPQPVGVPIYEDLVATIIDSDLDLVDSAYDQVRGEYWLGVPENESETIDAIWIFDLKRFLEQQELVWRKRLEDVHRLGVTSEF